MTFPSRHLYLAPPFLVGDYEPRAVRTAREGGMEEKVRLAVRELESCVACPRKCQVNRLQAGSRYHTQTLTF